MAVTLFQSAPKEELVRVQELVVQLEVVAVVHETDARGAKRVIMRNEKL